MTRRRLTQYELILIQNVQNMLFWKFEMLETCLSLFFQNAGKKNSETSNICPGLFFQIPAKHGV